MIEPAKLKKLSSPYWGHVLPRGMAVFLAVTVLAPVLSQAAVKSVSRPITVSKDDLLNYRVQRVLTELKSRPVRSLNSGQISEIAISPDKASFLSAVYSSRLVEASVATEMMSDKRVLAEILNRELQPEVAERFYPKTLGLREFLVKHSLLDGQGEVLRNGDAIEEALHAEFPSGFVARVAVGVAPRETGHGLYKDADQFILELLKPTSALYSAKQFRQAVKSHILGRVSSGEAVVLQDDVVGVAQAHKALKSPFFHEVRIHTYENRVVAGAVPERWVQHELSTSDEIARAEAFVAEFLKLLPVPLMTRQAWGVDVAVMDNGEMRIIDVLTNRGERIQWSSYLEQPRVISAYAKHFEQYAGVHFSGFAGVLLRSGFANYFAFWGKRIEKARPGLNKVLAYLPPFP